MRFHMWGRKGPQIRRQERAERRLLGYSFACLGLCPQKEAPQGEKLVAMVPGWLFGCLTPQPHVSPADKGRVLGSCVLCCDRCTLQGSLGSYRIGFTNSEPITPISFSQHSIWKIDEEKKCKVDWGFVLFFEKDTLCVLFSLLSQGRH